MRKIDSLVAFGFFLGSVLFSAADGFPATLPESTREMLQKIKLDSSVLTDIDEELRVPKEWIEGAKKEGQFRLFSTSSQREAEVLSAPFKERYPFIRIEHISGNREDKVKLLVAYRSGRILTDILFGVGGTFYEWKGMNGVEDPGSIPTLKNLPAGAKDPAGLWIGTNMVYWCIAYNTKLVRKEDLPRIWEDLVVNPRWRGGKLALGNRPNLWALQLWQAKGEAWTKDFLAKLFTELRPQLRKEGMGALVELLAAGEFDGVIPTGDNAASEAALKGAPVGFNCPEPVPVSITEAIILRGARNPNSAKVFMNWLLSKEGQIALYSSGYGMPVHKDLRQSGFSAFSNQLLGKELSFRGPGLEVEVLPKLVEFWSSLWLRASGTPRR